MVGARQLFWAPHWPHWPWSISRRRRHEHEAYRNEKVRAERYGSVAKLRQVQARDGAQNLPRHAQTLLLDSLPHEGAPASEEADAAKRILHAVAYYRDCPRLHGRHRSRPGVLRNSKRNGQSLEVL